MDPRLHRGGDRLQSIPTPSGYRACRGCLLEIGLQHSINCPGQSLLSTDVQPDILPSSHLVHNASNSIFPRLEWMLFSNGVTFPSPKPAAGTHFPHNCIPKLIHHPASS
jgi:hypothetical protein